MPQSVVIIFKSDGTSAGASETECVHFCFDLFLTPIAIKSRCIKPTKASRVKAFRLLVTQGKPTVTEK